MATKDRRNGGTLGDSFLFIIYHVIIYFYHFELGGSLGEGVRVSMACMRCSVWDGNRRITCCRVCLQLPRRASTLLIGRQYY